MAKRLPEITIDGFAIDLSNAPSPQWLPPNVTIQKVDNYTTDLPKDDHSTYDVVRVANLAAFIEDNNPGPVIKNVLAMLNILARYGLQVKSGQHRYRLPFAYAKIDNDTCFKDFEKLSYRMEDQEEGRELRQQMASAKEECDDGGHAITADLVVAVGRKEY
ncbi:MAG: hypothetical protein Q9186_001905 [Xanthomendoza sp. 1 TL-2023]